MVLADPAELSLGESALFGMLFSALLLGGALVTSNLQHEMFDGRSMRLFVLNNAYNLLLILVMGAVMGGGMELAGMFPETPPL